MSYQLLAELDSTRELAARMVPLFKYTSILMPELSAEHRELGTRVDVALSLQDKPGSTFCFTGLVTWLFEDSLLPCVLTLMPKDVATGHRLQYLTHQYKTEYGKLFDSLINSCGT